MEWQEVTSEMVESQQPEPCPVGPQGHTWTLGIEGPSGIKASSGCETCNDSVLGYAGTDDLSMAPLEGTLRFEPDHPNLGGWHGDVRCDCGYTWVFTPFVEEALSILGEVLVDHNAGGACPCHTCRRISMLYERMEHDDDAEG